MPKETRYRDRIERRLASERSRRERLSEAIARAREPRGEEVEA